MKTTVITILAGRATEALKQVKKLEKKAKRYGVDFGVTFGGVYQEERTIQSGLRPAKKVLVDVIDILISGETPKVGEYEFLAAIELGGPAGNFVDTVPGVEVSKDFRTTDGHCDHCKSNRPRKKVYAVRNTETGEVVQVGRTCLRDFLGIDDPAHIIGAFKFWRIFSDGEGEEGFGGFGSAQWMASLESLLAETNAIIRLWGWASKGMAYNDDRITATIEIIWQARGSCDDARELQKTIRDEQRDSDYTLAQEVIDWVRTSTGDSDYMHNLRVAFSDDVLYDERRAGLAISAVASFHRAKDRELKRTEAQRANRDSKHQGEIKERLKSLKVTLTETRSMGDNGWGPTELLKFKDEEGNLFSWFTGAGTNRVDIDDKLVIDGTVKRHNDFHGILETQLTRVSIKEVL